MPSPLPNSLAEVLRATLSLVDYYGSSVDRSLTITELKRTLQASITELEVSILPRNGPLTTSSQFPRVASPGRGGTQSAAQQ